MTKKKVKDEPKKVEATRESNPPVRMCLIPEANLIALYKWLNSDTMSLPQNEVRAYLKLIADARLVEDKDIKK